MFLALLVIRSAITVPADLVDAFYTGTGHAFVSMSGVAFSAQPGARREEVSLTNLARNRWDVKADFRRGIAVGTTLPFRALFDDEAGMINRPAPRRLKPDVWSRPGGVAATVQEILIGMGRSPDEAHWLIGRRKVIARFDPKNAKGLLPSLAEAAGGSYDPKTDRIGFSPVRFRQQGLATLKRRMADPNRTEFVKGYLDPIFALALSNISNADLTAAYVKPGASVDIQIPASEANGSAISGYIAFKLRQFGNGADDFRNRIDLSVAPQLMFTSAGSVGLIVQQKGNAGQIVF